MHNFVNLNDVIKVYENVFVLWIIAACFSSFHFSFFYFKFMHIKRGDKMFRILYGAFRENFFHILYEIFVLCIIYCTPQNGGGKCVLTENIVRMHKIYGAIGAGRIMAEKSYNQSGTVFVAALPF